jgi:zinc-ribbon domain
MFCPKCGAQNIEDAKFCRGCGADISLVPQALTGRLSEKRAVGYDAEGQPYDESGGRIRRRKEPARLDKAISTGFTGLAFLIVSIILAFTRTGYDWWYWLLIPAFILIGGGIAEYVRYKQAEKKFNRLPPLEEPRTAMPPAPARVSALPPRNTSELVPPPSVTEGTTRHLDMSTEAPTRHITTPAEKSAKDV